MFEDVQACESYSQQAEVEIIPEQTKPQKDGSLQQEGVEERDKQLFYQLKAKFEPSKKPKQDSKVEQGLTNKRERKLTIKAMQKAGDT